eukprot:gene12347-biopygen2198
MTLSFLPVWNCQSPTRMEVVDAIHCLMEAVSNDQNDLNPGGNGGRRRTKTGKGEEGRGRRKRRAKEGGDGLGEGGAPAPLRHRDI